MARGDTSSRNQFEIIDLGFRLDDVRAFGLGDRDEEALIGAVSHAPARNLRRNGATQEEIEFLLSAALNSRDDIRRAGQIH